MRLAFTAVVLAFPLISPTAADDRANRAGAASTRTIARLPSGWAPEKTDF